MQIKNLRLEENTDKKKGEIFCRAIGDIFVMLVTYNNEAEIIERMDKIYKAVQSCYAVTDMHYTISTCFGVYKIKDNLPFFLMLDRGMGYLFVLEVTLFWWMGEVVTRSPYMNIPWNHFCFQKV